MKDSNGSVQSIDRVFDILEVLSATPQGLALSDLAAATSLHTSTAHRLLASLANRGYVRKDAETVSYTHLTLPTSDLVYLVERDGNEVVYLHKFEPLLRPISITSSVGLHNPMYCTGVGKSIMAYLPEKEVRAIWDGTQVIPFTPKTITTWEALQEDLSCVRERGYAIDDEEHDLGVRCIAAPIYNWNGTPVGAMSISGTVARMTPDKIEKFSPKLISTAEKISELMGWHA